MRARTKDDALLGQAVDELFVIDLKRSKPNFTKDMLYYILRRWQMTQEQDPGWVWKPSNSDPIGDELEQRLPPHLRARLPS